MRGFVVATLTACLAGPAAAIDTVTWLTSDLPPQYIAEGELSGMGIKDQQLRLIEASLPDVRNRTMQASISRLWYQIQHEDGMCGLGVLRNPEREKIAAFTRRAVVVPGFRLIIREEDKPLFTPFLDEQGEIDLAALQQNRKLGGGYVADRVYPGAIAGYIDGAARRAPLQRSVDNARLYQLLRLKRVDFVFGLAYESAYYSWKFGPAMALASLPVKGAPRTASGYTACSNRPQGRAMIARLDALQSDEEFWRKWLEPMKRWLDPADFTVAMAGGQ